MLPAKGSILTTIFTCVIFLFLIAFEFVNVYTRFVTIKRITTLRIGFLFLSGSCAHDHICHRRISGRLLFGAYYKLEKKTENQEQLPSGELTAPRS